MWGVRGDRAARQERLIDGFAALDADLITLQETVVTDGHDQVREILGDTYTLLHQSRREPDGQGITTAVRWPVEETIELGLDVSMRTGDLAATSLMTEALAPEPLGRIWLVNHLPEWALDRAVERERQAVRTARAIEGLLEDRPGHVIVAGDLDADPDSVSIRFWTGRSSLEGTSICYRDAWESAGHGNGTTFAPDNPYAADWDWPFRRIDYILVRCGSRWSAITTVWWPIWAL